MATDSTINANMASQAPDLVQAIQNGDLVQNRSEADLTADNRTAPTADEARFGQDVQPGEEATEARASDQQNRVERQNEIEFRNNDGDTATITKQGRDASQVSMNQPI